MHRCVCAFSLQGLLGVTLTLETTSSSNSSSSSSSGGGGGTGIGSSGFTTTTASNSSKSSAPQSLYHAYFPSADPSFMLGSSTGGMGGILSPLSPLSSHHHHKSHAPPESTSVYRVPVRSHCDDVVGSLALLMDSAEVRV